MNDPVIRFEFRDPLKTRMGEVIADAQARSRHDASERKWRRIALLLAAAYFISLLLQVEDSWIKALAGLGALISCYCAGLSRFGFHTRLPNKQS